MFVDNQSQVAEYQIITNNFSAEFGRNSGSQVQIITKSGTNQFRGSVFEYYRNDKLDAQDYFQNYFNPPGSTPTPKNLLRQNQYGFLLTGPAFVTGQMIIGARGSRGGGSAETGCARTTILPRRT